MAIADSQIADIYVQSDTANLARCAKCVFSFSHSHFSACYGAVNFFSTFFKEKIAVHSHGSLLAGKFCWLEFFFVNFNFGAFSRANGGTIWSPLGNRRYCTKEPNTQEQQFHETHRQSITGVVEPSDGSTTL